MNPRILEQVLELEEKLHSLEHREEALSGEEAQLREKMVLLQREQRSHPQPLRLALDQTERSIGEILELIRAQSETDETQRRSRREEQERREEQLKERIRDISARITRTEEDFSQQRALVLAQISDLDRDLLQQSDKQKIRLERTQKEEEQRKDTQLSQMVSDRRVTVEMVVKEELLSVWREEIALNDQCFSEVVDVLADTTELWEQITLMKTYKEDNDQGLELRRDRHRQLSQDNQRLSEVMAQTSRQMAAQTQRFWSLREEEESSMEVTNTLWCEWRALLEKERRQRCQLQALQQELRRELRDKRQAESHLQRATEGLQQLIQDPGSPPSLLQKLSEMFGAEACGISHSELALYSVRQFQGAKASEDRVREEAERSLEPLTDPLFLLTCLRRSDTSAWPRPSWDRPASAPSSTTSSTPFSAPSSMAFSAPSSAPFSTRRSAPRFKPLASCAPGFSVCAPADPELTSD